jgi:hypothetical protein
MYRTDEWEDVADMSTKRWGAGVAVIEKRLWVIGGMNGAERGALPTLEVYDPGPALNPESLKPWDRACPLATSLLPCLSTRRFHGYPG